MDGPALRNVRLYPEKKRFSRRPAAYRVHPRTDTGDFFSAKPAHVPGITVNFLYAPDLMRIPGPVDRGDFHNHQKQEKRRVLP